MQLVGDALAVLGPDEDTVLSRWIERDGSLSAYDRRIDTILCPVIPVGGTVIDVGACLGTHTVAYARAVGPTGTVWAFEPSFAAVQCLRHNVHAYPSVHVVHAAVGETLGFQPFAVNRSNAGASQIAPEGTLTLTVALDRFTFPRVDYLKIDVEGYELHVLLGARQTIRWHRPIVVVETGRWLARYGATPEDLLDFFAEIRYGVERLPDERDPGDPLVYDLLARPLVPPV